MRSLACCLDRGFSEIGRQKYSRAAPERSAYHARDVEANRHRNRGYARAARRASGRDMRPVQRGREYPMQYGAAFLRQTLFSLSNATLYYFPLNATSSKNQSGRLHTGIDIGIIAHGDEILQQIEKIASDIHFRHRTCFSAHWQCESREKP